MRPLLSSLVQKLERECVEYREFAIAACTDPRLFGAWLWDEREES